MRLCIFVEPQQGATYADQLRLAQHAEACGFDGFFRSDHYLSMGRDGRPGPTDAWTALAGLAVQTSRIRLGTLVSSATFRLPGPLAIAIAQVDAMSGGRVELGLGAGWFEREHAAYGIPFPPVRTRFDRLEEQLAIITGLWRTPDGETFSFAGQHFRLTDSPALPKPVQQPAPPVIVGGHGRKRTPELAARYADEFNVGFSPVDEVADLYARVRDACDATDRGGRGPMRYSVAQTVCCGTTDAEVARRADAIGHKVDELRERGLCGTPAEIAEKIGRLAAVGAERVYLQALDMSDLAHLDLLASEVAPQLA
jgi:F420-dependent oxidoreductase-like protein